MENIISELRIVSPIPISVNHFLGYRGVMKHGRPVAVSYVTNEAKKYKADFTEYVIEEVARQGYNLEPNKERHFYVDSVFYFDKTDRDCNNYYKTMLDAITDAGLIWLDDNVVCERVQRIYYDPENPRIELYIHPVDYIGIFDNMSQLEEFENNCIGCRRHKRNCSILAKAKAGRIQSEINGLTCIKRSLHVDTK